MNRRILFVVESGWKGMREASLEYLKKGYMVDIIIKGYVKNDIIDMITKPDGLRLLFIPRCLFRTYLILYLFTHKLLTDLSTIYVSKERTLRFIQRLGFRPNIFIESE